VAAELQPEAVEDSKGQRQRSACQQLLFQGEIGQKHASMINPIMVEIGLIFRAVGMPRARRQSLSGY
jgi:hypothetical protein